jgi:hypothetical protein
VTIFQTAQNGAKKAANILKSKKKLTNGNSFRLLEKEKLKIEVPDQNSQEEV